MSYRTGGLLGLWMLAAACAHHPVSASPPGGRAARAVFALTATGTLGSPLASFGLLSPPR